MNRSPMSTPVYHLQSMLRTLASVQRDLPYLHPDGHFGAYTLEAVMRFQKQQGFPVTGQVDPKTWTRLTEVCAKIRNTHRPASAVRLVPPIFPALSPGDSAPQLFPIQGMFQALSSVLDGILPAPPSGTLDPATEQNIRWLQRCSGQDETGILDADLWQRLCRLYEVFVSRSPSVPLIQ